MRTMRSSSRRCDRAREYASLRLDGELSEFERVLLDSHLERCPSCHAFAEDLVAVTDHLRSAPLEAPQLAITLPRRRFAGVRGIQASAAAAAIVSVVGIGALLGLLQSGATSPSAVVANQLTPMAQERQQFQDLRRWSALTTRQPGRKPGGLGVLDV
jgi:predicted anti-sigma-YlaC factor YlaD